MSEVVMERGRLDITDEERARRSAAMRALNEKRRGMPRPPRSPVPKPTQREPHMPPPVQVRHFDWETSPLLEAQNRYATLKAEYEKAGRILNARTTRPLDETFSCYICHSVHHRPAKAVDNFSIKDDNGLVVLVEICGERCWLVHQQNLIDARREREIAAMGR